MCIRDRFGPSLNDTSPINIFEFKYTPVASLVAFALYIAPILVITPVHELHHRSQRQPDVHC